MFSPGKARTAAYIAFGLAAAAGVQSIYSRMKRKPDLGFLRGDMVFVPGFKGTHLHDRKTKRKVYMTLALALNLIKPDLRLETDWDHPDAETALVPGEVITTLAGGLVNLTGDFVSAMRAREKECPDFRFHVFAYDWRRDNLTSARELEEFVAGICKQNGGRPVWCLGFSMGGLLSLHMLHMRPELVRGLLLVGSPIGSVRSILPTLNQGDKLLFNDTAHSDVTQSTWASGYSMLCDGSELFLDADTGELVDLDLWNPDTWVERELSTAIRKAVAEGRKEEARAFMAKVLERGKIFNRDMRKYDPAIRYPPIATVHGRNRMAGYTYKASFRDGKLSEVDWTHPVKSVPADGTAPQYSIALPPGIPVVGDYESEVIHREMMNDPVVFKALRAIVEAELQAEAAEGKRFD
ncbi:hypothetical protein DFJ74DRAFT_641273 [Hyaloraphidium curvatum]|nr:hypothetical protein DFJ74DRAFT_641273 [Hyaloraphidium curvatum]